MWHCDAVNSIPSWNNKAAVILATLIDNRCIMYNEVGCDIVGRSHQKETKSICITKLDYRYYPTTDSKKGE